MEKTNREGARGNEKEKINKRIKITNHNHGHIITLPCRKKLSKCSRSR
jgi:hypothetical protein